VLEQIAVLEGVDFVVVAQPYIAMNTTPEALKKFPGKQQRCSADLLKSMSQNSGFEALECLLSAKWG